MKWIQKSEPAEYRVWCTPAEDWNPDWAALDEDRPMKRLLKLALLAEQGEVCCYCEVRISQDAMLIEHLVPRAQVRGSSAEIAYDNLLASCPARPKRTPRRLRTCGDRKGDRALPLTPLQPRCEHAFTFGSDGSVRARPGEHEEDGKTALQILGLDSEDLTRQRAAALSPWLEILEELTADEFDRLVVAHRQPGADGKLAEFSGAVIQVLSRYRDAGQAP